MGRGGKPPPVSSCIFLFGRCALSARTRGANENTSLLVMDRINSFQHEILKILNEQNGPNLISRNCFKRFNENKLQICLITSRINEIVPHFESIKLVLLAPLRHTQKYEAIFFTSIEDFHQFCSITSLNLNLNVNM